MIWKRRLQLSVVLLSVLALLTLFGGEHGYAEARGSRDAADGLGIARAYLDGMERGRLEALDRLFLSDGRSSVFENASDEGSWEHYRDHHLRPEMESVGNFKFVVTDEKADLFDSTILVRQVGGFTFQVGEEIRAYRAAVSYVIVEDAGELKIAHLHWSSRPKR